MEQGSKSVLERAAAVATLLGLPVAIAGTMYAQKQVELQIKADKPSVSATSPARGNTSRQETSVVETEQNPKPSILMRLPRGESGLILKALFDNYDENLEESRWTDFDNKASRVRVHSTHQFVLGGQRHDWVILLITRVLGPKEISTRHNGACSITIGAVVTRDIDHNKREIVVSRFNLFETSELSLSAHDFSTSRANATTALLHYSSECSSNYLRTMRLHVTSFNSKDITLNTFDQLEMQQYKESANGRADALNNDIGPPRICTREWQVGVIPAPASPGFSFAVEDGGVSCPEDKSPQSYGGPQPTFDLGDLKLSTSQPQWVLPDDTIVSDNYDAGNQFQDSLGTGLLLGENEIQGHTLQLQAGSVAHNKQKHFLLSEQKDDGLFEKIRRSLQLYFEMRRKRQMEEHLREVLGKPEDDSLFEKIRRSLQLYFEVRRKRQMEEQLREVLGKPEEDSLFEKIRQSLQLYFEVRRKQQMEEQLCEQMFDRMMEQRCALLGKPGEGSLTVKILRPFRVYLEARKERQMREQTHEQMQEQIRELLGAQGGLRSHALDIGSLGYALPPQDLGYVLPPQDKDLTDENVQGLLRLHALEHSVQKTTLPPSRGQRGQSRSNVNYRIPFKK